MLNPAQQLFRAILLHNKLLSEENADKLLTAYPDIEQATQVLVNRKIIKPEIGPKLLALHKGKLEKMLAQAAAHAQAGTAPATAPAKAEPEHAPPAPDVGDDPSGVSIGSAAPVIAHGALPTGSRYQIDDDAIALEGGDVKAVDVFVNGKLDVTKAGRELVLALLKMARDLGASDIHIKAGAKPIMRKAAMLTEMNVDPIGPAAVENSLKAILNDVQRKHFETHQDIDFCFDAGPELGRFRTNFLLQHRGMDGVFRIIPNRVPTFDELKLPPIIKKFCDYRQGIVLVTGPKGSGKTTTLAALIDFINTNRPEHIITIEDPIEFVQPCKKGHVNQREVGAHTETFSNALRAALREAPDVIMVGEMRDLETTELAITAAETGHLVFATLHTPDAVRTIGRVLDVFPPEEQGQIRAMFSESLRGIVSQLLVPSADGGRMELATEIMFNTPAIGNTIRENRTFQLRATIQTGKKLGMVLMDESLINLAKDRRITKQDAIARAENVAWVEKELASLPDKIENYSGGSIRVGPKGS